MLKLMVNDWVFNFVILIVYVGQRIVRKVWRTPSDLIATVDQAGHK